MRQTERKRKEKSALGSRQRIGDLYCKDISEWIYKDRRQNTEGSTKKAVEVGGALRLRG